MASTEASAEGMPMVVARIAGLVGLASLSIVAVAGMLLKVASDRLVAIDRQ